MTNEKPFNLNHHIIGLLVDEPFFAALSRRMDKRATNAIPTAGVTVTEEGKLQMVYNPKFFAPLSDEARKDILKHEFYHIVFQHVTGGRFLSFRDMSQSERKIHNIAMDLAINGLPEMINKLPNAANPGPMMPSGEPMQAVIPGESHFADLPACQTYEWYLEALKKKQEEQQDGDGEGGQGDGEPGEGQPGKGDPFGNADSFDSHDDFGETEGTINEIAKERLKDAVKKAAEEAQRASNWGSVSSGMRQEILDRIQARVDWKKVLRYFVKTSQRADRRSTPRRLNRRFPKIHPGKRVRRHAKIAISIDQSGSVDDAMLAAFFAELNGLSEVAEFTVIPFDSNVGEDKIFVWKRGQTRKWERVLCGGTDFNPPTKYVNENGFDGHIILTDMCAPKPVSSKCQRMWMTTKANADRPYFQTNERVIAIDR